MIKIDSGLIISLGVDLPKDQQPAFIGHVQQTLNERVGLALIDALDDKQATHLIQLSKLKDPQVTTSWVQNNVPNYQQIISDQFDILMGEIAETTPGYLS